MAKLAFIGAGNMAGAIVEGILRSGAAAAGDIVMAVRWALVTGA